MAHWLVHVVLSLPFITIAFGLGIHVRSSVFDPERRDSLLHLASADSVPLLVSQLTSPLDPKRITSSRITVEWDSCSSSFSFCKSSSDQSFVASFSFLVDSSLLRVDSPFFRLLLRFLRYTGAQHLIDLSPSSMGNRSRTYFILFWESRS